VTRTSSPTATVGTEEVKTKTPCEVFGSASASASGVWRKKPLAAPLAASALSSVTMPVVVTAAPTTGETPPVP
jgi:hypothetical protein